MSVSWVGWTIKSTHKMAKACISMCNIQGCCETKRNGNLHSAKCVQGEGRWRNQQDNDRWWILDIENFWKQKLSCFPIKGRKPVPWLATYTDLHLGIIQWCPAVSPIIRIIFFRIGVQSVLVKSCLEKLAYLW